METAINIGCVGLILHCDDLIIKEIFQNHISEYFIFFPFSCRFACSLLRQGMRQISISTMNTDLIVPDSKKVFVYFRSQFQ